VQQGSQKLELMPESESHFFIRENQLLTYSFVRDEKGQVTHLVVQREGTEMGRAKKIK